MLNVPSERYMFCNPVYGWTRLSGGGREEGSGHPFRLREERGGGRKHRGGKVVYESGGKGRELDPNSWGQFFAADNHIIR